MAATIKNNVGWFQGLNGKGIIYLGQTSGGVEFLAIRSANSTDPAVLGTFKFLPKNNVLGAIGSGEAVMVSSVNLAALPDVAPDGLLDASGDIDFGATALANYPRIHDQSRAFYSVVTQENKPTDYSLVTQANVSGGGVTYVQGSGLSSSTSGFSLDSITTWVKANILLSIGIVVGLLEFAGVTNFTPLSPKYKKSGRKRR